MIDLRGDTTDGQALPWVDRTVAHLGLLFLCFKVQGFTLIPLSLIPALFLLPITARFLRDRSLKVLLVLVGLALINGLALAGTTPRGIGSVSSSYDFVSVVLWVICPPVLIAFGLWALSIVSLNRGLLLICVGGVAGAVASGSSFLQWKGSMGVYATVGALLIVRRSWIAGLAVLALSAAISAGVDARALLFFSITAGIALGLQNSKFGELLTQHRLLTISLMLFLVVGLSSVVTSAMRDGLFGVEIAQRTIDQTEDGKSVIVGGRVEWSATSILFETRPIGYGIGVAVNSGVQRSAVDAVEEVGGDYTSTYFTSTVLGQRTDLHSGLSNSWYYFGLGGILLTIFYLALMIYQLPALIGTSSFVGVASTFAILSASWDLFFSPMADQDRVILGALCALLASRRIGEFTRTSSGSLRNSIQPRGTDSQV